MSQRATINCRRCYEIARIIIGDAPNCGNPDILKRQLEKSLIRDSDLWTARNEALRALDDRQNSNQWEGTYSSSCDAAADQCVKCDYSSPRIAEMFQEKPEKE